LDTLGCIFLGFANDFKGHPILGIHDGHFLVMFFYFFPMKQIMIKLKEIWPFESYIEEMLGDYLLLW
jgi:hypothetical protein